MLAGKHDPHVVGADIFWGELAPCEHLVQIYDDQSSCLNALETFATAGLKRGDAVIVIATPANRQGVGHRLEAAGIDLDLARAENCYIDIDAAETLSRFMVNGWPDEGRFLAVVRDLLTRARGSDRRTVRAFGEMVALLWSRGHFAATVHLEHLWHNLYREEEFSLFCAYPKAGFTRKAEQSIREICEAHSKVYSEAA